MLHEFYTGHAEGESQKKANKNSTAFEQCFTRVLKYYIMQVSGFTTPDIEIQNDHEKDLLSVLVIPFRFGGFGWLPTRTDDKSFLLVKGVWNERF